MRRTVGTATRRCSGLPQGEKEVPKREIHIILDNYATHKHQKVKAWAEGTKRVHFHFIPTSSSWLNLIERFFSTLTQKRIRRGVVHSSAT